MSNCMNNGMSDGMSNLNTILECHHLSKEFKDATNTLNILSDIHFTLSKGEQIAIMGRSGSGKTTLLQILGGLDKPTSGKVLLQGHNIHAMSEQNRAELRNKTLGFVFQFHHLLPEFSALENVAMPLLIAKEEPSVAKKKALALLQAVGLKERVAHYSGSLSGGERQRVAIARAMVTSPMCILADEPTGNLDDENAAHVFEVMRTLNREFGTSFIIVTHDESLASKMDKIYFLQGGVFVG